MSNIVHTSCPQCPDLYFAARYPGFRLTCFHYDAQQRLILELEPLAPQSFYCPDCGMLLRDKDFREVSVHDWDITTAMPVIVRYKYRRYRCPCGHHATCHDQVPEWVLPGHRVTKNLAAFAQRLLSLRISVRDASEITGLDWRLLKELDKARLAVTDKEEDFHGVEHVAIDEFSIEKGHRYATVAMDLDDRRVLWVGKGKRRKDVQPFFDRLRQKQRDSQIVSVSVDMNAAFPRLVKDNLPKALLAYDLFHVMKNFTHDVLAVAKAESILRARKTFLELKKRERTKDHSERCQWQISLVKGAEWLVVRDQETLRPDKREQLERLREENALFRDLYPLAAKLRSIWRARTKEEALGELSSTIEICEAVAQEHAFPAAGKFANMLRSRAEGIANACIVKKGTNMLEGANNKIKVIKRVGYGYRDFEYFAMKVKAAFPGKKVLKQQKTNRTASLYWMGKGFPRILPQLC